MHAWTHACMHTHIETLFYNAEVEQTVFKSVVLSRSLPREDVGSLPGWFCSAASSDEGRLLCCVAFYIGRLSNSLGRTPCSDGLKGWHRHSPLLFLNYPYVLLKNLQKSKLH